MTGWEGEAVSVLCEKVTVPTIKKSEISKANTAHGCKPWLRLCASTLECQKLWVSMRRGINLSCSTETRDNTVQPPRRFCVRSKVKRVKTAVFRFSARRKWLKNKASERWKVVLPSLSQTLLMFCSAMFHQGLHSVCGAKSQTSQAGAATGSWSLGSTCPSCRSSPSASVWSYRWLKPRLPKLMDEQTALSKSVVLSLLGGPGPPAYFWSALIDPSTPHPIWSCGGERAIAIW